MTTLEQIQDLALKGVGRRNAEAMVKGTESFTAEELAVFRKFAGERQSRIAEKKAVGPKSTAQRVREHVARGNEIGPIDPRPRHRRLKERCRYDLEAFGWYYCRRFLKHRASRRMKEGLIRDIQNAILGGGKFVKEYGRGVGKTTWLEKIAIPWAICYGHRRFPGIIAATAALANTALDDIKSLLYQSHEIRADFPELGIPLAAIGGISQRAASMTSRGRPLGCVWSSKLIVLPSPTDERGAPLGPGCGAAVFAVGIGGAIRGLNVNGMRPDFIVFDDPQTRKIAHSPTMVNDVISYIHNDALGLAGHDRTLSAFVAITPQCFGDVATELTSKTKHPEWSVTVEPFVLRTCPGWESLVFDYCTAYNEDAANGDTRFTESRAWYRANREAFAAVEVLDPLQFDPSLEEDAVHHVLNLRASLGEAAFNAEVMMRVADEETDLALTADLVASRVNGAPRGVLPRGTRAVFAFCDINIGKGKGLSWTVVAFGPGHVAAVVDYGRYPERGSLIRKGMSADAKSASVSIAMVEVARKIANLNLRDAENRRITPIALGFDCGYETETVHRTVFRLNSSCALGFAVHAVKGFGERARDMKKGVILHGDHWFEIETRFRIRNRKKVTVAYSYIGSINAYWREKMQSGFLETQLMSGSLSLYGTDPTKHYLFANEIVAEKLVRKYQKERGGRLETSWDWLTTGAEHWCDSTVGCYVLASRYGYYERAGKILDRKIDGRIISPIYGYKLKTVDPLAAPNPDNPDREIRRDELFDPALNPAIVENAAYKDEPAQADAPAAHVATGPQRPVDSAPAVCLRHINRPSTFVHKFKRGRYRIK